MIVILVSKGSTFKAQIRCEIPKREQVSVLLCVTGIRLSPVCLFPLNWLGKNAGYRQNMLRINLADQKYYFQMLKLRLKERSELLF